MKRTILFLSLVLGSGLMLTNVYNSLIDARSWGSDMPVSFEAARQYFRSVNPGEFFRVFSPINQGLALLVLVLFWRSGKQVRRLLIMAVAFYVAADAMTFGYFYPRNAIMFNDAPLDIEKARAAWQEWSAMNWVRTLVVGAGVASTALALDALYRLRQPTAASAALKPALSN